MKKIIRRAYLNLVELFAGSSLRRFKTIDNLNTYLRSKLKPKIVGVYGGHKMYLDKQDSLHLSIHKKWEPLETDIMEKEVKKGDVVLDIGANIGYYTLLLAKLVGENGKVFAFEADPTNFSILKKNIMLNNYKNVILINKAVSEKNEKIKLFFRKENSAGHMIYNPRDGSKFIEIDSIRLDDYFKDLKKKINFIKMDIEGSEGGAIKGMKNILKKNHGANIISEFYPIGIHRFGLTSEEYLRLLVKKDCKLYEIKEDNKKLELTSIEKLVKKYTPEKKNYTNLLCVYEKNK